ncbi:CinA family nicotinamide mononucleotide deamidase-related protein [Synoicihabitans lomoniglobus]|uniref:CinA-like protein n=1 Tax=Synoicihabitans lomoniglobus TaxID=2909285 RepID=A0AAE9ZVG5_9BACT|nr:CinA family nicotinamide mononucleotide deamidase-related protein [Opitutaceae bacterium LMO-M01]WED64121.1 CinA family nicotinamide mononucleotide deamidase-related protein [Opitutaceae bacterium LMO-M01]
MVSPSPSQLSASSKRVNFELITLGDELLLGLTANGHLTFVGQELRKRGTQLSRNVTISDDIESITAQFRESWARADVVITTGGLGPTCDDRTREVIAEALGQKLVFDPAIEAAMLERFKSFGRRMTDNNLKQAYRFADGEVIPNAHGTAPGLWYAADGKVLVMLPGPPNELQPMLTEQVLPKLAALGLLTEGEVYVQLRTAGIGESALETRLQPIFQAHAGRLNVAFCAHQGQVDCRLSSASADLSADDVQAIAEKCAKLLGENFMGFGHDSLAKHCADMLRAAEATLAVAETATGGMLASAFTDICGATKFFAGGSVCYSNQSKMQLLDVPEDILMQHGAVSAENAVAMAAGAAEKLGADYGLAITGFAGPCGGTNENPIGTMFVALYTPVGVWSKRLRYPGRRDAVNRRAVNAALDWLRRELVRARDSEAALPRAIDLDA